MPVETIECQIVQGQLGRYLAGDALPSEAVRELERHIGGCSICQSEVATRRATLHALLGVAPEVPEANPLLDLLRQRSSSTTTMPTHAVTPHLTEPAPPVETELTLAPRRLFTKPILLSAGLAVVLIAMNVLTKGPTDLLGPRANAIGPTPKTTLIAAPAVSTVDDRLFRAEWESFGAADLAEFDADLSDIMPAWRWLSLDVWSEAPAEGEVEEGLVEDATDAVELDAAEAWEIFAVTETLLAEPAPAPAPTQPQTRRPRPSTTRPAARPVEAAPRPVTPTEPQIRIYPPES